MYNKLLYIYIYNNFNFYIIDLYKYNLMSKNKIVFGFLGGLPNENNVDLFNHWKNFFKINATKKDEIIIAVHPLFVPQGYASLTEEENNKIRSDNQNSIDSFVTNMNIKRENIIVVDKDSHVLTEWGTASLTFAQILLIQYCLMQEFNMTKFILLSNSDAPLMSLDQMVEELNSSSVSWFLGSSRDRNETGAENGNLGFFKNDMFKTKLRGNDINYDLYYSQSMILHKKHMKYFFLEEITIKNKQPTWIKNYEIIYGCAVENKKQHIELVNENLVNVNDKESYNTIKKFIDFFLKPYTDNEYEKGDKINHCYPIEECIFGNIIMKNILKENINADITKEFKMMTLENLDNRLDIITNSFESKLNQIEDKFKEENLIITNNIQNLNNLKKLYTNHVNGRKFWLGTTLPFFMERDGLSENSKQNNIFIPSTYCDWKNISYEPLNILRSFKIKVSTLQNVYPNDQYIMLIKNIKRVNMLNDDKIELGNVSEEKKKQISQSNKYENLKWVKFNINEFLKSDAPEIALQKLIDNDNELTDNGITKLINNKILVNRDLYVSAGLPGSWHPCEYTSWSLRDMVNAFIFLNYLKTALLESPEKYKYKYYTPLHFYFNDAYEFYKKEIINAGMEINKTIINDVIIEIPTFNKKSHITKENYTINKYISTLNIDNLIGARSLGSLFIRKVMNNSKIDRYSNFLFEKEYEVIGPYVNQLIVKELPKYGLTFNSYSEFKSELNKIYDINMQDIRNIIYLSPESGNHDNFNSFKKLKRNINAENQLIDFIMNHITNCNSFNKIVDEKKNLFLKFNNQSNLIVKIGESIGAGFNNEVINVYVVNDDKKETYQETILRYLKFNIKRPYVTTAELTKVAFSENLVSILLTIIQNKVLNLKIIPNAYMIGYDNATIINDEDMVIANVENFEETNNKFSQEIQKSILNGKFIFTLNEKINENCKDFLLNNPTLSNFIDITLKALCNLKILQDKFLFFHGDFKLDNIMYKRKNNDFDVLFIDFGNSQLKIFDLIIKNNNSGTRENFRKLLENFNGSIDIVYYLLTTIEFMHEKIYNILDSTTPEHKRLVKTHSEIIYEIIKLINSLDVKSSNKVLQSNIFVKKYDSILPPNIDSFIATLPRTQRGLIPHFHDIIGNIDTKIINNITCENVINYLNNKKITNKHKCDPQYNKSSYILHTINQKSNLKGGYLDDNMYQKYLKYKNKYLKLKHKLNKYNN